MIQTSSFGAIIKKLLEIHPEMGVREMNEIIQNCIIRSKHPSGVFIESVDEKKALDLAQAMFSVEM